MYLLEDPDTRIKKRDWHGISCTENIRALLQQQSDFS